MSAKVLVVKTTPGGRSSVAFEVDLSGGVDRAAAELHALVNLCEETFTPEQVQAWLAEAARKQAEEGALDGHQ